MQLKDFLSLYPNIQTQIPSKVIKVFDRIRILHQNESDAEEDRDTKFQKSRGLQYRVEGFQRGDWTKRLG
uniref:Uncharacterized protein n=1 Tax=Candidatus Methanophagaceae archaeon ANME-1 ERB6 TaxID=2759912 RepID=A0A7G9YV45_9EURY|nr:hypothetical protein KDDDHKLF_00006 [Methanosarcinales archaeon ANME-1 ERB6]